MYVEAPAGRWRAVADAIVARRLELGLTQAQALARAGGEVSSSTWSLLERAPADKTSYEKKKLRAVAIALDWKPDSIELILAGQLPIEAVDPLDDTVVSLQKRRSEDAVTRGALRDVLDELQLLRRDVASLVSRIERLEQGS